MPNKKIGYLLVGIVVLMTINVNVLTILPVNAAEYDNIDF